ncbi:recombinase family protein [Hymenobacter latericus]|uniref:recombinase family protein n=1 Tax=Hymenobacter sp. YIM 151858-1 TaxID=2987688 RepID=UPI0022268CC4|nr:recombinase family protein [Hymenobacter sp. YIM 151858-1]UYZ61233.1 recombinase family protein [Hymenobacter sp. YIM 151858-1]
MPAFVAYYRVSTAKQGQSGLGLEAQRNMVQAFVKEGTLIGEFTEVESGKHAARPQLHLAMQLAKTHGAVLVIAKLDRLSRNVSFIASLMDAGVEFVATDQPQANKFTVHIFAALAEQERDLIAERTRKALAVLKRQGKQLGSPQNLTAEARQKGLAARQANARASEANRQATALIVSRRAQQASYNQIAAELNALGFRTRRGAAYTHKQVQRLWLRAAPSSQA